MTFSAVIGANFGDEGKGRTVDFLSRQSNQPPLIVRYNSGAQAGHTVVSGDKRHVFSQHGSSLRPYAQTLLCNKFVLDPTRFNAEYEVLTDIHEMCIPPIVWLGEDVAMSTPLDVLLNQMQEISRGHGRHGSCGMGFGETLLRRERHPGLMWHHFDELTEYFLSEVDKRSLDVKDCIQADVYQAVKAGNFNWGVYEKEVFRMLKRVSMIGDTAVFLETQEDVIFEGAQGLLLHQDHEFFPHVTRCRTGIEDIIELLSENQIYEEDLHVYYCSRSYLTRHGAGPLPAELDGLPFKRVEDATNVPNNYQGKLRFAHLDVDFVRKTIKNDLSKVGDRIRVIPHISLGCCDQVDAMNVSDQIRRAEGMASALSADITDGKCIFGFGPDSADTFERNVGTTAYA